MAAKGAGGVHNKLEALSHSGATPPSTGLLPYPSLNTALTGEL